ncbi:MAG TPA: hypothetical protein VLY45_04050 [Nitrospiria bacterium]|nr:hypothetical protein [Nitrospiria bacterium]
MKQVITNKIMTLDLAEDKGCQQRKVVKTKILSFNAVTGRSSERWTVDRCGLLVNYLVTLAPGYHGATDLFVQRNQ